MAFKRPFLSSIGTGILVLGFFVGVYYGINALGKLFTPTVLHHEAEHAHCYTAGKMFFVSIACVPKTAPPPPSIIDPLAYETMPFIYVPPEVDEAFPAIYFVIPEETF